MWIALEHFSTSKGCSFQDISTFLMASSIDPIDTGQLAIHRFISYQLRHEQARSTPMCSFKRIPSSPLLKAIKQLSWDILKAGMLSVLKLLLPASPLSLSLSIYIFLLSSILFLSITHVSFYNIQTLTHSQIYKYEYGEKVDSVKDSGDKMLAELKSYHKVFLLLGKKNTWLWGPNLIRMSGWQAFKSKTQKTTQLIK